jgi:hypothetical protein
MYLLILVRQRSQVAQSIKVGQGTGLIKLQVRRVIIMASLLIQKRRLKSSCVLGYDLWG